MKYVVIIPSRYKSTRFPGKGIADICGRPMRWVYQSVLKSKNISSAYVVIDDERTKTVCEKWNIPFLMTSEDCQTHFERLYEASTQVDADFYINTNGKVFISFITFLCGKGGRCA